MKRGGEDHGIAAATFEGQGERVYAHDIFNRRQNWSFGPFLFNAVLSVTVLYKHDKGHWVDSKLIGPIVVGNR